jgi:hypothetical protein
MGLQSYVVIIQIDKSYIKFNNNRINTSHCTKLHNYTQSTSGYGPT